MIDDVFKIELRKNNYRIAFTWPGVRALEAGIPPEGIFLSFRSILRVSSQKFLNWKFFNCSLILKQSCDLSQMQWLFNSYSILWLYFGYMELYNCDRWIRNCATDVKNSHMLQWLHRDVNFILRWLPCAIISTSIIYIFKYLALTEYRFTECTCLQLTFYMISLCDIC